MTTPDPVDPETWARRILDRPDQVHTADPEKLRGLLDEIRGLRARIGEQDAVGDTVSVARLQRFIAEQRQRAEDMTPEGRPHRFWMQGGMENVIDDLEVELGLRPSEDAVPEVTS